MSDTESDLNFKTCANCGSKILGKFCYNCGQNTDTHHRSIFHLIYEALEGMFHFDGRLWRTLPALFFRPGSLNRDFIEGKVARHVPPFRMFLVSLFVLILTTEHGFEKFLHEAEHGQAQHGQSHATATTQAKEGENEYYTPNEGDIKINSPKEVSEFMEGKNEELIKQVESAKTDVPIVKTMLLNAVKQPKVFMINVFGWAHRLAIVLLPITALSLGLVYFYKRKYYLYDHFIVSMNIMSFIFFSTAICMVLPSPFGGYLYGMLYIITPIYIYFTLRGAYQSSRWGAILKSVSVSILTSISFLALLLLISGIAAIYTT